MNQRDVIRAMPLMGASPLSSSSAAVGTQSAGATAAGASPLLEARQITVLRGNHSAVNDVSFDLHVGEFVAVMGRSGAGKTSLMHALSGLVMPLAGRVHWTDLCHGACCEKKTMPTAQRRAVMFQHYRLVPQLSALTNVLCGRLREHSWWQTIRGFSAAERAVALEWLTRLGIGDRAALAARRLSGGEQQRVAVARAMIQEPDLLLADEPVASLDAETANEVMQLFQDLNRSRGLTVLCVLHDLEMAERFAGRVLLLDEGRLVYDGPTANLQRIVHDTLQWKTLL